MDIEIQRIVQLSDTTYGDYTGLRVRKNNGTRKLYGNITVNTALDNDIRIGMVAFIKQGGEYRMMPYKMKRMPFCDFFRQDTFFYEEATMYSDFPYPVPCPCPTRVYGVYGYLPSLKNVPQMILHTGDYSCEFSIYDKANKEVFKARAYISIINF